MNGWRILIVEDDPFIAEGLAAALTDEGAEIIGPASTITDGLALVESAARMDAAILDVNLRGEEAFAVADALTARGVPLVFATGRDSTTIPDRYAKILCCGKPFGIGRIVEALTGGAVRPLVGSGN